MDKNGLYILKALDDTYVAGTLVEQGFPQLTENHLEAIIFDYKGVEKLVEKMYEVIDRSFAVIGE